MSFFKDGFEEPAVDLPDKTIFEQIKDFDTATHGLASLNIIELDDINRLSGFNSLNKTFQFRLLLASQYMKGYSFNIFDIGYDVSLYPSVINLQSEIGVELGFKKDYFGNYMVGCNHEEELLALLSGIFHSNKFKNTVGGLMKLARAKAERA